MTRQAFKAILQKYQQGTLSEEEWDALDEAIRDGSFYELLGEDMKLTSGFDVSHPSWNEEKEAAMLQNIKERGHIASTIPMRSARLRRFLYWSAAAAVLFFTVAAVYWLLPGSSQHTLTATVPVDTHDAAPGRDGARLKLTNGRTILIDTAKDGLLAVEGTVKIYKDKGKILYVGNGTEPLYNEIYTDRGRQWSATLPDGTVVKLNAASSLRYPLHFTGNERLVELTGEGWFQVAHNTARPFRVKVGRQLVEDIGTIFNISAYADEPRVATTLIEGAASVAAGGKKVLLKPGQQASGSLATDELKVSTANVETVTAWLNGKFKFENADLHILMRQIARWYDVQVVYEAAITNDLFTGGTFRNEKLSEVLKVLELNGGVHFRIENKKVYVSL